MGARDPLPALISLRAGLLRNSADKNAIFECLRQLAFAMLQSDTPQRIADDGSQPNTGLATLIDAAVDIGILERKANWLRFQSPLHHAYLASGFISRRNFAGYLSPPQFTASRRVSQKPDLVIKLLVDGCDDAEAVGHDPDHCRG